MSATEWTREPPTVAGTHEWLDAYDGCVHKIIVIGSDVGPLYKMRDWSGYSPIVGSIWPVGTKWRGPIAAEEKA